MKSLEDLVQYSRELLLDGSNDVYESTLRLIQKLDELEEYNRQYSQELTDLNLEA